MAHYRIYQYGETDFEVRIWRWWWPFWVVAGGGNRSASLHLAECWARGYAGVPERVAKVLGPL